MDATMKMQLHLSTIINGTHSKTWRYGWGGNKNPSLLSSGGRIQFQEQMASGLNASSLSVHIREPEGNPNTRRSILNTTGSCQASGLAALVDFGWSAIQAQRRFSGNMKKDILTQLVMGISNILGYQRRHTFKWWRWYSWDSLIRRL